MTPAEITVNTHADHPAPHADRGLQFCQAVFDCAVTQPVVGSVTTVGAAGRFSSEVVLHYESGSPSVSHSQIARRSHPA